VRSSFSQKVTALFVRKDSNNDVRTASMSLTIGEAHAVRGEAQNPMHGGGDDGCGESVRSSDQKARASDHRPFDSDPGTIVTTDSGKLVPRKLATQSTLMDRLMGRAKKKDLYEVYVSPAASGSHSCANLCPTSHQSQVCQRDADNEGNGHCARRARRHQEKKLLEESLLVCYAIP
jgi:hypothetical protein